MKKAYGKNKRNIVYLFLISVCFIFLTTGCGLDVISVVLEDPVSSSDEPNQTSQFGEMSFTFSTHKLDNSNNMGHNYVAYKIYNKQSILESEVNTLQNILNDSNRKQNSAVSLLNTYYYRYLNIKGAASDKDSSQLEIDNGSHEIRIRLSNYDDTSEEYSAGIWVDGKRKGFPCRVSGAYSFDFGRKGDFDVIPQKDDEDAKNFVENPLEEEKGNYYVALFSVFMMFDDDYSAIYSPIHYLGCVKIDSNSENN